MEQAGFDTGDVGVQGGGDEGGDEVGAAGEGGEGEGVLGVGCCHCFFWGGVWGGFGEVWVF